MAPRPAGLALLRHRDTPPHALTSAPPDDRAWAPELHPVARLDRDAYRPVR